MLILLPALGAIMAMVALWCLPKWQVRHVEVLKDRIELEIEARKTLAQILGGGLLIAGLYFTAETLRVNQEGQITERFTRAIGQLGNKEALEVRLGGIYALERIARDSERDHWPIMEVLTAYVRENAPWKKHELSKKGKTVTRPPIDIQAILTVLGRRRLANEGKDQYLNLVLTDLRYANLQGAHLERAHLMLAHLETAILVDVHLEDAALHEAHLETAVLFGAHLERAILQYAHLEEASLLRAHLEGAILQGAHLERANLEGAHLEGAVLQGAHLEGANLTGAIGLIQTQISSAFADEKTRLPEHLKAPPKATRSPKWERSNNTPLSRTVGPMR